MKDLFKEFEKEDKKTYIHADWQRVEVEGYPAALLTTLVQIIKSLSQCPAIERKDIEKAVELAYMSDTELSKEALKKVKSILEKVDKSLNKEFKESLETEKDALEKEIKDNE